MLSSSEKIATSALLKRAGIKYREVYYELLDHFFDSVEHQMREGNSFENALKKVEQDFGGAKGLKLIEKRYCQHLHYIYWQNFLKLLQGNQFFGSLSLGLLAYTLCYLLKGSHYLFFGIAFIGFIPFIIGAFSFFKYWKTAKGSFLLKTGEVGLYAMAFFVICSRIFYNEGLLEKDSILFYPGLVSFMLTFYLLHFLTFVKTFDRFHLKVL